MGSEGSGGALEALAPASNRLQIGVGAAIVLVLVALVVAVVVALLGDAGGSSQTIGASDPGSVSPSEAGAAVEVQAPPELLVHVLGAVITPGLYSMRDGARVIDAVAAAGGLSDDADQAQINLARPVSDGEQIIVPRVGEAPLPGAGGVGGGGGAASAGGKLNLNVATASELEALPRIGPAMAARIVEWREANGRFTSVEDLLSVTGIGEKTLDGLRDLVSV